nr:hypothetical protein CFP56_32234 [Quercus suber]
MALATGCKKRVPCTVLAGHSGAWRESLKVAGRARWRGADGSEARTTPRSSSDTPNPVSFESTALCVAWLRSRQALWREPQCEAGTSYNGSKDGPCFDRLNV